jgi:[acyl-carrier-protein] S-malonyltransferase
MIEFFALFPGQGSQMAGMGKAFAAASPEAAELFAEADRVLGYSLSRLCFEGPLEELTLTRNAQPALLTVSTVAFRAAGLCPSAAAGHSLGEYSALVCAGSLNFADALQLVHKRGTYMQEAVKPGVGKMIAVLGPAVEEIQAELEAERSGVAEIANLNCPGQTVIAGDVSGVDAFAAAIAAAGAKVIPLNVSAPFHCSLMKPAAERLAKDLDSVRFDPPRFPVYANVTAQRISTGEEARELLKKQVCSPVRWTESIENALRDFEFTTSIEFGPGGVLSNLMKRICKTIIRKEVADPDSLAELKANA